MLIPPYLLSFHTQLLPADSLILTPSPVDFLSASPPRSLFCKGSGFAGRNHTFQCACFPLSLAASSSFSQAPHLLPSTSGESLVTVDQSEFTHRVTGAPRLPVTPYPDPCTHPSQALSPDSQLQQT